MGKKKNKGLLKYGIWCVVLTFVIVLSCLVLDEKKEMESPTETSRQTEQWEKGYDLPVDKERKEEAEKDCRARMEDIKNIFCKEKSAESNTVLSKGSVEKLKKELKKEGKPVADSQRYSQMENYEAMEKFLLDCREGKKGSVVLYYVKSGGGVNRMQFESDGEDIYVLETIAEWNNENEIMITGTSYTRVNNWSYTEKGWFAYELCAPQPPEITEVVDASMMVRVKPMDETCKDFSERCLQTMGYRGNNLLCSEWNSSDLSGLDFNGLFESLYEMKYGEMMEQENYEGGIPENEFESLMTEYLPITEEELRDRAHYDETSHTYAWVRLGTGNYAPTTFGTSVPEVVAVEERGNGVVLLTVEAVCMAACNDNVLTHTLTVQCNEDGSFRYLGNEIPDDDLAKIPEYQYRIRAS